MALFLNYSLKNLSIHSITVEDVQFLIAERDYLVDIARPIATAPMAIPEKGKNLENHQNNDPLSSVFGRSVDERVEKAGKALKPEPVNTAQNKSNQNQLESMVQSGHGHCQFYADCTECHRFKALPANASTESNTDNTFAQKKQSYSGYLVIVNTSESCKRIKVHSESTSSQNISRVIA